MYPLTHADRDLLKQQTTEIMTVQDLVEGHPEDEVRELAEEIVYEIRSSHLADDESIDPETEDRCCKIIETMFEDKIFDHKRRQKAEEQVA